MNKTAIGMLALAFTGCGEKRAAQEEAGMQAMVMQADSLMPAMRSHLDSLAGMSASRVAGVLGTHDAMASRMLDAMGSDMRMMGMPGDSAWTALADSVKRDLAELPALSGAALEARLKAHVQRMGRLLELHERMM